MGLKLKRGDTVVVISGKEKGKRGEVERVIPKENRVVVGGVYRMSLVLWRAIDVGVIDGLANGVATAAQTLGDSWRRWSTGNVQHYALTVLVGVVLLIVAVAVGITG